jgi:EmrB/QacA subfamily drug resistance transporter
VPADHVQRWTLRVVCVSTALLLLNVAAPQVAQSAIAESVGASFTDLQWVLSGYALALAVFLLTAGSLADRFGRRRLFLLGLAMFSLASALCAIAPGSRTLIAARIVQGLGAAVVFPSSLAILAEAFQGDQRRRAIGAWGATIGLAFAAGPLIGGLLVDLFGWRAIFAASFVLGAPTLLLALRHIIESRDPDPPPVDWAGVGTLSVGLFAGVFAVLRGNALGWTSSTVLGCLALCAVALGAFVAVERATARPMLDLRLFRNPTFSGATAIVALLAGGPFGAFVYVTLFLLDVQARDPVEAGLVLMPLALVAFVVSAAAGRASERVPLRGAIGAGMLITAAGMLALRAGLSEDASWLALLPGVAITGVGVGLATPLTTFAHLGVLPPAQGGLASGINNTARQLGLAVGIAVLGAVLQSTIAARVEERTDGLGGARGAVTDRIADGDVAAATQLAPLALVSFVVSAAAGRLSERVPLREALLAGMLVTAAGMLLLRAGISDDASWLALLPGLSVTGVGVGLANPLVTFAHLGVLPPAQGGLASALNNTARQIGLAIGIAVLGALLEAGIGEGHAFADEVGELLLISAGLSLLAAVAAAVLVRQHDMWAPPSR